MDATTTQPKASTKTKAPADIEIEKHALLGALDVVCLVTVERTTDTIDHVMIDADPDAGAIEFTATNHIQSAWLDRPAVVRKGIAFGIHARLLRDFVKTVGDGPVSFRIDGNHCEVSQARRRYALPILAPNEYAGHAERPTFDLIPVPVTDLAELLAATEGAMASPIGQAIYAGIHVETTDDRLRCVALDGSRLHYAERTLTLSRPAAPWKFTIPHVAVSMIKGLFEFCEDGNLAIGSDGTSVAFRGLGVLFETKTIIGEFPSAWREVYSPPTNWSARIDRTELLRAMRLAKNVQGEAIGIYPFPPMLGIKAMDDRRGTFRDEIPWEPTGTLPPPTGLGSTYLVDALAALPTKYVTIGSNGEMTAVVLRPEIPEDGPASDQRFAKDCAVLMPMYLPGNDPRLPKTEPQR